MLKGVWLFYSSFLNNYSNKVWRFKYIFIPLRCLKVENSLNVSVKIEFVNI